MVRCIVDEERGLGPSLDPPHRRVNVQFIEPLIEVYIVSIDD